MPNNKKETLHESRFTKIEYFPEYKIILTTLKTNFFLTKDFQKEMNIWMIFYKQLSIEYIVTDNQINQIPEIEQMKWLHSYFIKLFDKREIHWDIIMPPDDPRKVKMIKTIFSFFPEYVHWRILDKFDLSNYQKKNY